MICWFLPTNQKSARSKISTQTQKYWQTISTNTRSRSDHYQLQGLILKPYTPTLTSVIIYNQNSLQTLRMNPQVNKPKDAAKTGRPRTTTRRRVIGTKKLYAGQLRNVKKSKTAKASQRMTSQLHVEVRGIYHSMVTSSSFKNSIKLTISDSWTIKRLTDAAQSQICQSPAEVREMQRLVALNSQNGRLFTLSYGVASRDEHTPGTWTDLTNGSASLRSQGFRNTNTSEEKPLLLDWGWARRAD